MNGELRGWRLHAGHVAFLRLQGWHGDAGGGDAGHAAGVLARHLGDLRGDRAVVAGQRRLRRGDANRQHVVVGGG